MRTETKLLAIAIALPAAGCGGEEGELTIRASKAPLSASVKPVPARIAEAQGQLALGNVALALESYRKALRDDPRSIDAMAGIAASYDQMGRFDLSRRYYEMALAVEPANPGVLRALAASLTRQGRSDEAAAIHAEMDRRREVAVVAPVVATPIAHAAFEPVALPEPEPIVDSAELEVGRIATPQNVAAVFEPADAAPQSAAASAAQPSSATMASAVGRSVTVTLPPARPAAAAPQPVPSRADRAPTEIRKPAQHAAAAGARLERLSLGEVALVTSKQPVWRPTLVAATARSSTIRFVPLRQAQRPPAGIRLLNAARIQGLAARTRATLVGRGWRGIAIGNAAMIRPKSVVLYPAESRKTAQRLAAQFGFPLAQRPTSKQVTVLLGRDAAFIARKLPAA